MLACERRRGVGTGVRKPLGALDKNLKSASCSGRQEEYSGGICVFIYGLAVYLSCMFPLADTRPYPSFKDRVVKRVGPKKTLWVG